MQVLSFGLAVGKDLPYDDMLAAHKDSFGPNSAKGQKRVRLLWAERTAAAFFMHISVPTFTMSWMSKTKEILAFHTKTFSLRLARIPLQVHEFRLEVGHFQVDHFVTGELPVILNRRFQTSQYESDASFKVLVVREVNPIRSGAGSLNPEPALKTHGIRKPNGKRGKGIVTLRKVEVQLAPYWCNAEMSVLFRLFDIIKRDRGSLQLDGSRPTFDSNTVGSVDRLLPIDTGNLVSEPRNRSALCFYRVFMPIAQPSDQSGLIRLKKLEVGDIKITINLRTPSSREVLPSEDPFLAMFGIHFIGLMMYLPLDTPNMSLQINSKVFEDSVGTRSMLIKRYANVYSREARRKTIFSATMSYVLLILLGLYNGLQALIYGVVDGVRAATLVPTTMIPAAVVYGVREGLYRFLAEVLGNLFHFIAWFFSIPYKLVLGQNRPRAQSMLDGFIQGVRGLVVDSLFTPTQLLIRQGRTLLYESSGDFTWIALLQVCEFNIFKFQSTILQLISFKK